MDLSFAGKAKAVSIADNVNDNNGINKKYIDKNGIYDPATALEEFSKTFEKRFLREDTYTLIEQKFLSIEQKNCSFSFKLLILKDTSKIMFKTKSLSGSIDQCCLLLLYFGSPTTFIDSHLNLNR